VSIPPDDVKKFLQQLHALDKVAEIKIYPEAGHAFENPNNQTGYRADDAADAWKRTTAFFAATLKKE
jgi:carboxymethylenebutenolidase